MTHRFGLVALAFLSLPLDADESLAYLALVSDGLVRVEVESGASELCVDYATLGVADGDSIVLRFGNDHLWIATGPERMVRLGT